MGLEEHLILGKLSDELESDIPQEEINELSIFQYNQFQLITFIGERISKYELKFLLDELKDSNEEFWTLVLGKIIGKYSLNSLKPYLSSGFRMFNIKTEIPKLLYFLKIDFIDIIIDKKINTDITRKELFRLLKSTNNIIPKLFIRSINLIDNESFEGLVRILINESKLEFSD